MSDDDYSDDTPAESFMDLWQEQMAAMMTDPRAVSNLLSMLQMMQNAQGAGKQSAGKSSANWGQYGANFPFLNAFQQGGSASGGARPASRADAAQYDELARRLAACEGRLAALESRLAEKVAKPRTQNGTSRKRRSTKRVTETRRRTSRRS